MTTTNDLEESIMTTKNETDEKRVLLNQVTIKCPYCGEEVTLNLVGGQYQHSFEGRCSCDEYLLLCGENDNTSEIPRRI